jgi:hypothetical protein
VGLDVEAPTGVEGKKTPGDLVDDPSLWLFVMPEVEAPKPSQVDVVMVAGH